MKRPRILLRRAARILGIAAAALLAFVAILLFSLMLRPVRDLVLRTAMSQVQARLPGTLTLDGVGWRSLGSIELAGILWVDEGDTLAAADTLTLEVDLVALTRRDVRARRIVITDLILDLPALLAAFPSAPESSRTATVEGREPGFPRRGALPGLPSLAADDVVIRASRARLSPTWILVDGEIAGGWDLTPDGGPRLGLSRLSVRTLENSLAVEAQHLDLDGRVGRLGGDFTARFDSLGTLNVHLVSTTEHLELTATLRPDSLGSELRMELQGRPAWSEKRLQALDFNAEVVVPGTDDLAGWPFSIRQVARLSPLPPLALRADGTLTLSPRFTIRAHVESVPTGWLERLEFAGSYDENRTGVDTLQVSLPGLRLTASGERTGATLVAQAHAVVTDGRWLAVVSPGFDPPDSLAADLRLSLDGASRKPSVALDLEGGYRAGDLAIRQAKVAARFPQGLREQGSLTVSAVSQELRLQTALWLAVRTPFDVEVSPILVESLEFPESTAAEPSGDRGRVRYDPASGNMDVEDLRVSGAFGNGRLDGELLGGSGTAAVEWAFPSPPRVLRGAIAVPDSSWDSLMVRWRSDGPFELQCRARFGAPLDSRVSWEGELQLPGPRTLRALLLPGARVEDWGAVSGRYGGRFEASPGGAAWAAFLDLSPTPWIEITPIRIEGSPDRLALDSLRVAIEGLAVSLGGGRTGRDWDVHGAVDLSDARPLRRLVPGTTEKDSCAIFVEADVRGDEPDLSIRFRGGGRYHGVTVPDLAGHVARRDTSWDARLEAAQGLAGPGFALTRITAEFATQEGRRGLFPARAGLVLAGTDLSLTSRGIIDQQEGWGLSADTLGVTVGGKDLQSRHPFRFRAHGKNSGYRFEEIDLAGTLGSLRANGVLRPEVSDLDLQMVLELSEVPPPPRWAPDFWPDHVEVSLRTDGSSGVLAEAHVDGLDLSGSGSGSGSGSQSVMVTARGDTAGLGGKVQVEASGGDVLSGEYFLPGTWQTYPPRIRVTPRGLRGRLTMEEFQIPWKALGIEGSVVPPATLSGELRLDSDMAGPMARAELTVALADREKGGVPTHFTTQAIWIAAPSQRAGVAGVFPPLSEVNEDHLRDLAGPGLTASFALSRAAAPELTGSLLALFRETPEGRYVLDPDRGIDLEASAPRLDLTDLSAFLPAGYQLTGTLGLKLTLQGSPKNPALNGGIEAAGVELQTGKGSRALGSGKLDYSGTLLAPNVQGRIEIRNALISIPEAPRKLHPPSGESHLWRAQGAHGAARDSAAGTGSREPATEGRADSAGTKAFRPVYDLELVVPSGCWIRGRNLNVELGGDLRLRQKEGHPTVVGMLEARQGTLIFLGRSFQLDRGKVQFYGEDELNPTLDIRLTATVSSTTVYVTMSGTALEPEIELTSTPSLSEGDIMSLLVMGKTSDDLEGDQAELVAQRAAAIAATYGAAELEKSLAGPLGVDMITLNPGGGPEGESSVVVGKYLSPRALLKYEQALDSAAGFFVTLQYTLTKTITLETIAGTWQSGAEISWSKDY